MDWELQTLQVSRDVFYSLLSWQVSVVEEMLMVLRGLHDSFQDSSLEI